MNYCFINGNFLPVEQANIRLNDLGLLRGFSIFDYFRTHNGHKFLENEHFNRFHQSAQKMGLKSPLDTYNLSELTDELLQQSGYQEAGFRLLLTGGYTEDGISLPEQTNFAIICEKLPVVPLERFQTGISIITTQHLREMPDVKTTNYIKVILMQGEIKAQKAIDVLYHYNQKVSELSRSNFFMFKNNVLITPKDDILFGITRRNVILLAKNHFQVEERDVQMSEVFAADECFTTGTTKKVTPIVRIDGQNIGNGTVGKQTALLMQEFDKILP